MTAASLVLSPVLSLVVPPLVGLVVPGAASPAPAEVVRTPPADLVTPGTIGFLVTFGVAVALVLLVRDMVRRNRGLVVRAERRDAELRAQGAVDGGDDPGDPDGTGAPVTRSEQPTTPRERGAEDGQGRAAPNG